MRKLNLNPQELKALYPLMSDAFDKIVQSTLYDLEHRKERPIVKKKISAALIFAMILVLATLGVAYALTQSNLLKIMFGGNTKVPEGLEEIVSKPEATVTTPDAKVTLSEYLFDGERLHLYWTIANQTDRQIMVTMNPFMINGMKALWGRMDVNAEGFPLIQTANNHGIGQILGGEVDGFALPGSVNYYSIYDNPGEYMEEYHTFIEGETLEITSDLYIWELLSTPDPVITDEIFKLLTTNNPSIPDNHKVHEDLFDAKALRGIPTDRSGLCGLNWLIGNDNYDIININYPVDLLSPEENQSTYEKKGWARLILKQPVKFSITLDTKAIKQAKPVKTDFETNDYTLNIKQMAYMPTGGTMVLYTEPTANSPARSGVIPNGYGFAILDADTKELLGSPRSAGAGSGPDGYYYEEYTIVLSPVPGRMPQTILIVPVVSNPEWDKNDSSFDPKAALDPNNISLFKFDMENAMKVELEWQ